MDAVGTPPTGKRNENRYAPGEAAPSGKISGLIEERCGSTNELPHTRLPQHCQAKPLMPLIVPLVPSASAIHGFWFVFAYEGHQFALWVSSITGKEALYVDGALAATRRKISMTSVHEVAVAGAKYTLELRTESLSRGKFKCVLHDNGVPVAALETEYVVNGRWKQSAAAIAGTALVIFAAWKTGVSANVACAGLVVVGAMIHFWLGRRNGYTIRPATVQEMECQA